MAITIAREDGALVLHTGNVVTFLTGPGKHTPREIGARVRDELAHIAAGTVPRRVRYAVLLRAGVSVIRSDEEVPAVPFLEVLARNAPRYDR